MKTALFSLLFAAAAAAPAGAFAKGMPSKTMIAQRFEVWNAALQTGSAEKVAALYCNPGAVLLPTVSNKVRITHAGIVDYFEHFLELKPSGKIDASYIRMLGPDAAVDSGVYTFHVTKNGKAENVRARFTFVYQKRHGKWCILDHHSSAMPEPETGKAAH